MPHYWAIPISLNDAITKHQYKTVIRNCVRVQTFNYGPAPHSRWQLSNQVSLIFIKSMQLTRVVMNSLYTFAHVTVDFPNLSRNAHYFDDDFPEFSLTVVNDDSIWITQALSYNKHNHKSTRQICVQRYAAIHSVLFCFVFIYSQTVDILSALEVGYNVVRITLADMDLDTFVKSHEAYRRWHWRRGQIVLWRSILRPNNIHKTKSPNFNY